MLERVRQRLLHDPVGGQVDARRQLAALALDRQLDRKPRVAHLRDERLELSERRLRRERDVLVVGAQHAQQPPHLGQRRRAGRLDCVERLVALGARRAVTRAARLEHDHADRVRDDVVQLTAMRVRSSATAARARSSRS